MPSPRHWSPYQPPSLQLSLILKSSSLWSSFSPFFISPPSFPLSVLRCVYKILILISLQQQVYAPISRLSCFALSSSGWFLHRPRYKLILELCPWFPPISPWALTCQCCPPLGSLSCCNYLWHSGSGAFHTGDKVEGWVGAVDERGKGGSLFAHNSCLSSRRN